MIFNVHEKERKILALIGQAGQELGFPVYIVGGIVRDRFLGRSSQDIDIVCVGSGIALAKKVQSLLPGKPKLAIYQRFGTAMLLTKSGLELEFVGARKESYRSDSRKPSVENGSIEDDQNRRDFTINAMAVSLNPEDFGEVIDPFNGLEHLQQKLLVTPLEPGKTFSDDPLRMLRAIRFATQLGFTIEENTFRAIQQYKNRIAIVSQERITIELQKIMASPKPSTGWILLFKSGLLEIIFPELYAMHGVSIKNNIGHKDNFYHTVQVLDNLAAKSDNIWLRWAALLHDIGKPVTKRWSDESGWTFHGHEAIGAHMIKRIFKRLKLPLGSEMRYVRHLVRLHQRPIALTNKEISESAIRRIIFEAGDALDDLMELCESDITSKSQEKVQRYLRNYKKLREKFKEVEQRDKIRNWQPPINGEEIMTTFNIPPGRVVGLIKDHIREAILDGVIPNDHDAARQLMFAKAKELGLKKVE